ncbi:hypothetical protein CYMTET_50017 [Cymbomonas tetramitiformis]|uniref:C3H1-type domain-containing protein n=1 Tax=Cymbomonas tetramitiformis TaxID=36881 RepID=A0AAE0BP18_9CHLO|nr:hypothetical protein CYMTET_50017 [Cymbomonas tetramitiformis]
MGDRWGDYGGGRGGGGKGGKGGKGGAADGPAERINSAFVIQDNWKEPEPGSRVCFEFQRTGKCNREGCRFEHRREGENNGEQQGAQARAEWAAKAQVRRNADGSIELVDSGPPAKTEESYLTAAGTQMSLDDAKKILEAAKGLKKKKRKKDRNDKEDRKRRKKEKKEKHKKKKEKDKRKEEKKRKKKKKNHNSSDSASSGSSDSSDSGESDKEDGAPENPKDNELPPDDFDVPKITAEDDYFAKNHEFSAWLRQEHDVFFTELLSDRARELFKTFVEEWNARRLTLKFYKGITVQGRR